MGPADGACPQGHRHVEFRAPCRQEVKATGRVPKPDWAAKDGDTVAELHVTSLKYGGRGTQAEGTARAKIRWH